MSDLRQQHGDHTWDRVVNYVTCPFCNLIIENRQKYESIHGLYQRDFGCSRCHRTFTDKKHRLPNNSNFDVWID